MKTGTRVSFRQDDRILAGAISCIRRYPEKPWEPDRAVIYIGEERFTIPVNQLQIVAVTA